MTPARSQGSVSVGYLFRSVLEDRLDPSGLSADHESADLKVFSNENTVCHLPCESIDLSCTPDAFDELGEDICDFPGGFCEVAECNGMSVGGGGL